MKGLENVGTAAGGIEGRHVRIGVLELSVVWTAYAERWIDALDFRVWLAAKEMSERRRYLSKERQARYSLRELHGLVGGQGGTVLRSSLRRLERLGILRARRRTLTFLSTLEEFKGPSSEPSARMLALMPPKRRSFPLPRRVLRFLATGTRRSTASAILGELICCAFYRRSTGWTGEGNVTASWIAGAFSVSERSVLRARKELEEVSFLQRIKTPVWHTRTYGARYRVNFGWSAENACSDVARGRQPTRRLSGVHPQTDPSLSGLESNLPPLRGKIKNQEPAPSAEPAVGFRKRGSPRSQGLLHVRETDLSDTGSLLRLLAAARGLGLVGSSEMDELNFVASAERARARGTSNPCGLFVWSVLRGFPFLSCAEEDAARRRLRSVRESEASIWPAPLLGKAENPVSEDAVFLRALRSRLRTFGVADDPFPHLHRERPDWTRERWDRAVAELDGPQRAHVGNTACGAAGSDRHGVHPQPTPATASRLVRGQRGETLCPERLKAKSEHSCLHPMTRVPRPCGRERSQPQLERETMP